MTQCWIWAKGEFCFVKFTFFSLLLPFLVPSFNMDVLAKSFELISCANEIKKILQDIDYCMAVAFLWSLNFVNSVHICMLQQSYSSSTAILLESLVS